MYKTFKIRFSFQVILLTTQDVFVTQKKVKSYLNNIISYKRFKKEIKITKWRCNEKVIEKSNWCHHRKK